MLISIILKRKNQTTVFFQSHSQFISNCNFIQFQFGSNNFHSHDSNKRRYVVNNFVGTISLQFVKIICFIKIDKHLIYTIWKVGFKITRAKETSTFWTRALHNLADLKARPRSVGRLKIVARSRGFLCSPDLPTRSADSLVSAAQNSEWFFDRQMSCRMEAWKQKKT